MEKYLLDFYSKCVENNTERKYKKLLNYTNECVFSSITEINDIFDGSIIKFYDRITNKISSMLDDLFYICDSSDINEPIEYGDYSYYYGMISNTVGILYMHPSHETIPARVIFYGPVYQISINGDWVGIDVCPVNLNVYGIFFMSDEFIRRNSFINHLKHTSRPLLNY